ncbi:MAG: DUF3341 domain-containing protein [Gemmatimonadota bacterium]|nr:MAG: DUF3341 domain-containing protein [Gemmatimonadota bacterium]
MSRQKSGVLAAFRQVDAATDAIKALKELGHKDFIVYTPVPNVEVAAAIGHKVSSVRVWTLIGGLLGVTTGFAMTLWMSYDYPIVVGGKPLGSIVPYVVIGFELTILFGALATLAGVAFNAWKTNQPGPFDPRFTNDTIGIFVPCEEDRTGPIEELLTSNGATEVRYES